MNEYLNELGKGMAGINITIYDQRQIGETRLHPEKSGYDSPSLGFCSRFVDLSSKMQDYVIQRAVGVGNNT